MQALSGGLQERPALTPHCACPPLSVSRAPGNFSHFGAWTSCFSFLCEGGFHEGGMQAVTLLSRGVLCTQHLTLCWEGC